MGDRLEIIFEAVDKASGTFGKVKSELKGLGKESSGTTTIMKALGVALPAIGITSFGAALGIAAKAVKGAADDTLAYANQVRDLTLAIGATPEEASKLIQVADDMGIEFGQLEVALQGAIRKGIEPTVENIGKMSDAYLKLEPGVERTKFLMDNFGRSGADLARLMELGSQKIEAMGESIEGTSMLMTDKGLAAAEGYRVAMDNFNDSITQVKYKVGLWAMPAITNLINGILDLKGTLLKASGAWDEYQKSQKKAAVDIDGLLKGTTKLDLSMYELSGGIRVVIDGMQELTEATVSYSSWQEIANATVAAGIPNMTYFSDAEEIAMQMALMGAQAVQKLGNETQTAANKAKPAGEAIKQALDFHDLDMGLADAIGREIDKALVLVKSGGKWMELQNQFKQVLELQNVDPAKQAAMLAILETQALQLELDLGMITFDQFRKSIEDLGLKFGISAKTAESLRLKLQELLGYSGKTVSVDVLMKWIQQGQWQWRPELPNPKAKGDDFIVPSGYPNDTYPISVSSGERVIVMTRAQQAAAGAVGGDGYAPGVGQAVYIQNNYTLNMATNADRERIADDFMLMAAWNR